MPSPLHRADPASLSPKHRAHVPLNDAAKRGDVEEIRSLLFLGHDVDETDRDGRTALRIAAELGSDECVRELVDGGAEVDAPSFTSPTSKAAGGTTALRSAAEAGNATCVLHLLHAKARVDQANTYGYTSLMVAAKMGHVDTVRVLLEANASVNRVDLDGRTALRIAAADGQDVTVRLLLAARAAVDVASSNGRTPLWVAAAYGHEDCVRTLVAAKAAVDWADENGETPLQVAEKAAGLNDETARSQLASLDACKQHAVNLTKVPPAARHVAQAVAEAAVEKGASASDAALVAVELSTALVEKGVSPVEANKIAEEVTPSLYIATVAASAAVDAMGWPSIVSPRSRPMSPAGRSPGFAEANVRLTVAQLLRSVRERSPGAHGRSPRGRSRQSRTRPKPRSRSPTRNSPTRSLATNVVVVERDGP